MKIRYSTNCKYIDEGRLWDIPVGTVINIQPKLFIYKNPGTYAVFKMQINAIERYNTFEWGLLDCRIRGITENIDAYTELKYGVNDYQNKVIEEFTFYED